MVINGLQGLDHAKNLKVIEKVRCAVWYMVIALPLNNFTSTSKCKTTPKS